MQNLFEQFKSKFQAPGTPIESVPVPGQANQEQLDQARMQVEQLKNAFQQNYQIAQLYLPPGESARFEIVKTLPELFEQKISQYVDQLQAAGKDVTSQETVDYIKSALLNFNAKDSGPVYKTMESVLRENAIAPSDGPGSPDVAFHQFFRTAPAQLIDAMVRVAVNE